MKILDPARLIRAVEEGLPFKALETFQSKLSLTTPQVLKLLRIPRTLCARYDHRVALRARPATDRVVEAKDLVLEITIANAGTEALQIGNGVEVEVRSVGKLSEDFRRSAPRPVTIVFEEEDPSNLNVLLWHGLERSFPTLELRSGETAEAAIPLSDLVPWASGAGTFKVWTISSGRISAPVRIAVDFGPSHEPTTELKRLEPGESSDSGPFRKVGPLDRLLRFAAQNALLLVVFAVALCLIILSARRDRAR